MRVFFSQKYVKTPIFKFFWKKQLQNSQKMRTFEKKYYFCT